jgi:hypothetical protein
MFSKHSSGLISHCSSSLPPSARTIVSRITYLVSLVIVQVVDSSPLLALGFGCLENMSYSEGLQGDDDLWGLWAF